MIHNIQIKIQLNSQNTSMRIHPQDMASLSLNQFLQLFSLTLEPLQLLQVTKTTVLGNILIVTDTILNDTLPNKEYEYVIALNLTRIMDIHSSLLPNPITAWYSPKLTHIGQNAFKNASITHFFALSLWFIGKSAFENSKCLKYLVFSKLTHIGASAFSGSEIDSMYAPNLQKIEANVFSGTKLKNLYSEKMQIVGQSAFSECVLIENLVGFTAQMILRCSCKACFKCLRNFSVLSFSKLSFLQFVSKAHWDFLDLNFQSSQKMDVQKLQNISFQLKSSTQRVNQLAELIEQAQKRSVSKPQKQTQEEREIASVKLEFDLQLKKKDQEILTLKKLLKVQNDEFQRQKHNWDGFVEMVSKQIEGDKEFDQQEENFYNTAKQIIAKLEKVQ